MQAFLELPSEIVAEIFYYCLPSTPYIRPDSKNAPLLLTHICSWWRKLAHQTPSLWSNLGVESQLFHECDSYEQCQNKCFHQFEHWRRYSSESLPFDLQIILNFRGPQVVPACIGRLISMIAQNTSNIRRLYMTLNGGNTERIDPFLPLNSSSMPRLEAIHLYNLKSFQFMLSAPRLRKVILEHPLPHGETTLLPFTQLTHLIIASQISHNKFSALLADCPALEEFSCTLYSDDGVGRRGAGSVSAIALRLLDITFDFHHETDGPGPTPKIFLFVLFPFLESFALRVIPGSARFQWNPTAARDHLFEQLHNLKTLQLGYQIMSCNNLLDLIKLTPNLTNFALDSPYMNYIQLFSALTYSPSQKDNQLILSHLEDFELYVDFDLNPNPQSPHQFFTHSQFMSMVTSRSLLSLSTIPADLIAPVPLKRVYVSLDCFPQEKLDVELLKKSGRDFRASDNQLTLTILNSIDKSEWMKPIIQTWDD